MLFSSPTNIAEEWVDQAHVQLKDEETRRISAVTSLNMVEKKMEDLSTKLTKANRERKSTKAALIGAKKQAED